MSFQKLKSNWFALLLSALLFSVAVVKYRHGMLPIDGVDLSVPYTYARVWLGGDNPYDADKLTQYFNDAGGREFKSFNLKYLPPIYPVFSCIVMTPIAMLSWDQALRAWSIAAPIMVTILVATLLKLAGIGFKDPRVLILILFCIVFTPVRSAVTLGQSALPAICVAMLAVLALSRRRDVLAGCLLAIAIGFKVQDGLFVLIYIALLREWRAVGWCIAVLAAMTLVVIVRAGPLHPWWVFDVLHWLRDASLPGAIIDPAAPNPARFQMIHLPVLLSTFIRVPSIVTTLNLLICGTLGWFVCTTLLRRFGKPLDRRPDLLSLGALAIFCLLPLYHRFPDATLLLLPMAWAIARLGTPQQLVGQITLVLLLPFLLQPYDVIPRLLASGHVSRAMYDAWWFQCFVRASVVWMLLAITCWLLVLLRRERRAGSAFSPSPLPSP